MKTYSIIIPHRNNPTLLSRCLDSIPERNDINIIVIDDNSDDMFISEFEKNCSKHKNVIYKLTSEGLGAGYARNVGLEMIKNSQWLIFADADDYFLPNAFSCFDQHKNDKEDIIFFHSTCRFSDTGNIGNRHLHLVTIIDNYINKPTEQTEGLLRYNYDEPWGKMIRTSLVLENNINFEQTRWANDVHFSTMIGIYAKLIAAYKEEVYCVTISHNSLVHQHSLESRLCRYEVLLRKNKLLREFNKSQFQVSLMYSLKWAAKYGGIKAILQFIKIGRKYNADFTIGYKSWIRNFFVSHKEYKDRKQYIVK